MEFSRNFFKATQWVCLIVCFAALAFSQSERGTITGAVRDASGASVPGAAVIITNQDTNVAIHASTNQDGEYTVPNLSPGVYIVRVEKSGFRPSEERGLTLNAAQSVRADASLQIGTSTQAVEVQASAVSLQTEDAKSSTTLQNKLVNDLPLVVSGTVRTPFDLAALTPDAKNLGGDNGFAVGGGQVAAYGTTLDGVSANTSRALSKSWVASNSPSVEAIDQFTVDSSGYKAEYGHGAGVMTFVSKSGTNGYHGSAYEFIRNNDFDANNFFSNASHIANSIYKQNDFGFTAGGPVWIPKVYHGKDKTFFFFSYEGFRNRTGANGTAFTVPTPEMYNGDFTKWVTSAGVMIPIYNPLSQVTNADGSVTRTPFPGNIVPKSLYSPAFQKALGVFQSGGAIAPNNGATPGTAAYISNNYLETGGTQIYPVNKYSIKGDHVFNEKHRISGYYGNDREHQTYGPDGPPTLPGLYSNYNDLIQYSDVIRFSWTWTLSPTKINYFYAGGNNWRQDHKPPQEYIGNWQGKFCLTDVPNCNENLVNLFSGGTSDNYSTWGGQADNGSENTVYSYNDDFTWIRGKHTLKFGGMYQLNHYNGFGRQCEAGCIGFSYEETGAPGVTNPNSGGNAFASALLGLADSGQIDTVRFIGQQFYYFAGYFQDDFKITPKLNLNIGLRWDANLPPTGLADRWTDFSPTTMNPVGVPGAVLFAGNCNGCVGSRTLANFWNKGYGAHIGLAYSWDAKTVIRASYARSYGSLVSVSGSTHNSGYTLTQTDSNTSNGIIPTYTVDQGFPPYTVPPFINPAVSNGTNVAWFQGNETTKLPAYDNIYFSVERQFAGSMVLEAAYNGVMGEHLQAELLDYNQINPKYLTAFGTVAQSTTVLNSLVGSATANAAGVFAPFPTFNTLWGSRATVAQALRPFPQYNVIDTYAGQGDHSGHSTYHSGQLKFQKRLSHGLTLQTSYVFSKILTDSDTAWGVAYAADLFNRGLEKSIGQFDVTHDFKFAAVYDLPFGRGQQYMTHGPAAWVLGNWRISSINLYSSGTPVNISSSYTLPIYAAGDSGSTRLPPYITSYAGWQPSYSGSFDPGKDNFFVPYGSGPFPLQGSNTAYNLIGNDTRYNPKLRLFPNLNENMSLTKSFPIREKMRVEFRAEAFNVFNRVRFGTGSTQLQNAQFGVLVGAGSQINTPRNLQLALKFYF
jgi:hypothetical protein